MRDMIDVLIAAAERSDKATAFVDLSKRYAPGVVRLSVKLLPIKRSTGRTVYHKVWYVDADKVSQATVELLLGGLQDKSHDDAVRAVLRNPSDCAAALRLLRHRYGVRV